MAWTHYPGAAATDRGAVADIDVNPDGTTWAFTELDVETDGNAFALSRFESGEWVTYPGPVLARETRFFEGFFGPLGPYFAAGAEGTAWVVDVRWADEQQLELVADLWKFEGRSWDVTQSVGAIGPERSGRIRAIDVGGDGVLWVRVEALITGYLSISEPGLFMSFDDGVPGGEWSEYPEPDIGVCGGMCRAPESDRSGTLWTFTADGIARLDGSEWTYLQREPEYASPNWSTREDIVFVADDGTKWATLGREVDGAGPPYELMSQIFVDNAWTTWPDEGANAGWTDSVAEVQGRYGFVAGMTGISDEHLFVSGGADLFWFEVGGGFELLDLGAEITALAPADGTIWIGTHEGVSRFNPAAW